MIRLLFDSYVNQNVYISWNNQVSKKIRPTNGVKQGGVLSPILFNLYIDELLISLRESGLGCKIGNSYYGVFGYADDVIILSPTSKGLQSMINICYNFGKQFHIQFNEKKTQCIQFGLNQTSKSKLYFGSELLTWAKKVKYLGNWLNNTLDDYDDIVFKKGMFIQNVNKLLSNFSFLQCDVLYHLYKSYCTSFYCCHIWDMTSLHCNSMQIAWNKSVRKIWGLPYITHTRYLPYICDDLFLLDQLLTRFLKMLSCMLNNSNKNISFIAKRAKRSSVGILGRNLIYLYHILKINIIAIQSKYLSNGFYSQAKYNSVSDHRIGHFIRTTCLIRDYQDEHIQLNFCEAKDIIDYLCTI